MEEQYRIAAFDSNLIGVTPNYHVEVIKDVLQERDGPMLLHGIQGLHKEKIIYLSKKSYGQTRKS